MNKVEKSKELVRLLLERGSVVNAGGLYAYLPYWFRIIDESNGVVEWYVHNDLPADLKKVLNDMRKSEYDQFTGKVYPILPSESFKSEE